MMIGLDKRIAHKTIDFWPRLDGCIKKFLVKFGHIVAVDASSLKLKKLPKSVKSLYYLKVLNFINVTDPNTNKTSKIKIMKFDSNPVSKDLNRRKIITKGAVVETKLGKDKVTSRPGQHGVLNGLLIV